MVRPWCLNSPACFQGPVEAAGTCNSTRCVYWMEQVQVTMTAGRMIGGLPATGTSHIPAPYRQLAKLGSTACQQQWGIQRFDERHRDSHSFARRTGRLPEQREEDSVDYRGLLHRDGTVLSLVTLEVRECANG